MSDLERVSPVDSFREAAQLLRRPFTPQAVKFKVQATWPKVKPTGGLIVSYIDARLVVERLNLIVPHLWHDRYEPLARHLICHLTVDGITRQDVGEGEGKALYSDALKRAAVKFGVGVSLYATPGQRLSKGVHLAERGDKLALTIEGERHVRDRYAEWLKSHGEDSFGAALSHGDIADSQGDHEADGQVIPDHFDRQTGEVIEAQNDTSPTAQALDRAIASLMADLGYTSESAKAKVDKYQTIAEKQKLHGKLAGLLDKKLAEEAADEETLVAKR